MHKPSHMHNTHAHTYTHEQTYTHLQTYTDLHTYAHIYTHIPRSKFPQAPIAYWTHRNHQSNKCLMVSIGKVKYGTHRNQQKFCVGPTARPIEILMDQQKAPIGPTFTHREILMDQQKCCILDQQPPTKNCWNPTNPFSWSNRKPLENCCWSIRIPTGEVLLVQQKTFYWSNRKPLEKLCWSIRIPIGKFYWSNRITIEIFSIVLLEIQKNSPYSNRNPT